MPTPATNSSAAPTTALAPVAAAQVAPLAVRALKALAALTVLAFALTRLGAVRDDLPLWVTGAMFVAVYVIATLLLLLRAALVPRQRLTWGLLGAGLGCYTSAMTYQWVLTGGATALTFPSVADVGWLLLYPVAGWGLVLLIRSQVSPPRTRVMLDGVVAGLGAAAILLAFALEIVMGSSGGGTDLASIITVLYPMGDALLLGLALCLLAVGGSTGRRELGVLIVSLLAWAASDTAFLVVKVHGGYYPGNPVDIGYLVAVALLGWAGWSRARGPAVRENAAVPIGLPIAFATSSLVLLVVATRTSMSPVVVTLASIALVLIVVRTLVSFSQIKSMALHDPLTGLPNRALITDRVEQLVARIRRNDKGGAALFIDLDGFKNVNDTLGHEAGDHLLRAAADRLTAIVRDVDTVGRMGGDEFVVLLDGTTLHAAPERVADRLLEAMRQPFELSDGATPILCTVSIGIATGGRDTGGELLRDADLALYRAKEAGKDRYEVFHPEMEAESLREHALELDLRTALENQEFRLVYQPVYDMDNLSLLGVEALLRWDHPELGVIPPDRFIPLLEGNGQIVDVGRWVLIEAFRQMKEWHEQRDDLFISVNMSARQLDDDRIIAHVVEALDASGLAPRHVMLEVTETALMKDVDVAVRRLRALKELGVQVAIDDFGTGYSSLSNLQRFPVDCLKLDRAFTDAITSSPEADALIHTLVQLGKDLGLTTIAEGVETEGQLDHLRGEAVNQAQGYLLSRPLTPQDLEGQLADSATRVTVGT